MSGYTELIDIWKAGEPQAEGTNSESCLQMNLKAKASLLLMIEASRKKENRTMTLLQRKLISWNQFDKFQSTCF